MSPYETLLMLSRDSTVMVEMLAEDADLIAIIRSGASYDALLAYVNESY